MPDLDLSALRKVAEAARGSMGGAHAFEAHFGPETVLALLDELENARTTIEEDKLHFAKAWHDGAQWAAVELGALDREENQWVTDSDNPYAEP